MLQVLGLLPLIAEFDGAGDAVAAILGTDDDDEDPSVPGAENPRRPRHRGGANGAG